MPCKVPRIWCVLSQRLYVNRATVETTLHGFDHPNIVDFYGVCTDDMPYYMILEYMDQGDLRKFLHFHKNMLRPSQLLDMCRQVACGMAYLESKNHIHCDLACLPQLPHAIGDDRKDRRLWYVPKSILAGLLSCVWRSLPPCPLDAPRGRDPWEILHEGGRVVVRSSSLGDLQLCHAAVLQLADRRCSRDDPTWQAAGEA